MVGDNTDPNRGGDAVALNMEGDAMGNIIANAGGMMFDTISKTNNALMGRKDKRSREASQVIGDLSAKVAANGLIQVRIFSCIFLILE